LAWCRNNQPDAREGQAGRLGVAARFVVPRKPGNAGGGRGPRAIASKSHTTHDLGEVCFIPTSLEPLVFYPQLFCLLLLHGIYRNVTQ